MNIAIIGLGSVGGTLGRRWAELGHAITFGIRDPSDAAPRTLAASINGKTDVASIADAVARSEIVVLAVPYDANRAVIAAAGDLSGKIIIDVTNPLAPDLSGLTIGHDSSGAEEVAALVPGARVYKALNQTGFETMGDPVFPAGRAVMFVAGDEPTGKATVLALVGALGFEAVDAGALKIARLLEPYAMLWIHLMVHQKIGRQFAFSLMRRG